MREIIDVARIEELQVQRSFLGDRAVNLAAELAVTHHQLKIAQERITELEKQLKEKTNVPDEA